jgi:hypothetical protein
MVHNEPVFLPIWIRNYSRFFGVDDVYILGNDTTDRSTDRGGFVRIPVGHGSVDHTWMVRTDAINASFSTATTCPRHGRR